jgi:membrane associated rhomboid family serine protease
VSSPKPSPFRRDPANRPRASSRSRWVDPTTWVGALVLMVVVAAVLWAVQVVNSMHRLTQFGLQARDAVGLRGVVTEPFLHADWAHLLSNTLPVILIGWAVLLSGARIWLVVTGVVVLGGGLLTWLVAPSDVVIVGASGVVFGWLGYLLARAVFSREVKWIVVAVVVLAFFGTLLFGLLPSVRAGVSWQAHACGFVAGVAAAALLHDPRGGPGLLAGRRSRRAVS